jgi:hypothetical protein
LSDEPRIQCQGTGHTQTPLWPFPGHIVKTSQACTCSIMSSSCSTSRSSSCSSSSSTCSNSSLQHMQRFTRGERGGGGLADEACVQCEGTGAKAQYTTRHY